MDPVLGIRVPDDHGLDRSLLRNRVRWDKKRVERGISVRGALAHLLCREAGDDRSFDLRLAGLARLAQVPLWREGQYTDFTARELDALAVRSQDAQDVARALGAGDEGDTHAGPRAVAALKAQVKGCRRESERGEDQLCASPGRAAARVARVTVGTQAVLAAVVVRGRVHSRDTVRERMPPVPVCGG